MAHEYSKFKNKNIPYAKVGRRVFNSLFDAETFCTEHSLDVNSAIEYRDDSELKNNIQTIAQYQKAILQECLDRLKARAEALDQEIKKQIVENDRAFDMDKESSILWMLHTQFGFGPKRLKLAWKLFYAETLKLREHYLMEQADDGWLARKKLKDIGCDIEEWYREEGGKTDA